ncbi:MAG: SMC family ATPase [Chloroflexia bacterium]
MIPTKLVLYNFLPYRGEVLLDLRAVRVACITGDNGAGKSSLLDAITWSLWGKARGAAERDLMSLGTTEMGVDFQFVLGGQEYRVVRRRRRRGNSPDVAQLEVQTRALSPDGEGPWRAITGDTLSRTQKLLTEAIGMEYDTFINSAFILQGRADEFTTKGPTDRKQVLADILGLGQYDALEERARALRRDREAARKDAEAQTERIERELAQRPQVDEELREVANALVLLIGEVNTLTDNLDVAKAQRDELNHRARQAVEAEERRDEHAREADRLRLRIASTGAKIAELEAIVAEAMPIRRGYADLGDALGREQVANATLATLHDLQRRHREAERAIEGARNRLLQEHHALDHQATELQGQQERLPQLEEQYARIAARLAALREAEDRRPILDESIRSAAEELGGRKAENEFLKKEMQQLKAQQEQIDAAGAECPLCRRPLAEHDRQQIHDHYQEDGLRLKEQFLANRQRVAQLDKEIADCNGQLEELVVLLKTGRMVAREEGDLRRQVTDVRAAGARLEQLTRERDQIAAKLAANDYARNEQVELAALDREIAALAYDPADHAQLRELVQRLRPFENRFHRLESAEREIVGERERLAEDRANLIVRDEARETAAALALELRAGLADLPVWNDRVVTLTFDLEAKTRQRDEQTRHQGRLEEALRRLDDLEDEVRTLRAERNRLAEEEGAYRDLSRAFGKGGIQAMIIEAAVPELQDEANAILANMPGNSMRVEFHTQRETRKGDTVEALDIRIGDEAGQRDYALYSGGESFRINFAIRVALAKLLARRAGARLQLLVIDEGFGTQDARGRDSLVEAIRSIENDFETILVITHVNELKDLFPTQIMVEKGPQGSSLSVV